ncbi:xanthine dehydrogenase accessory protein XdhC [Gluconacetobacter azotocaptans]|uniref:Xanthine dehydrogenase accessory protein XdhC n=1 Tax=Gluconacetobacter azotocaptans TaxID=142834 RepID=A0A7W4JRZ7_9PROT|nr:xanthine dehydrogenase accessory protein XdhC [Gluconacetobacter azotocaptans]MBB2189831.1 xanthine dehydrogenase accessory protein XdhC [Gluconacetobacter azotocaptans]GBQ37558.1 xanthine dehydrogenase XdhC [Gluconacetobacter azotocaptans DSM 13594]
MDEIISAMRHWLADGQPVAHVRILSTRGSTPREEGAFMLVTPSAQAGTIGGGRLEWDCVADARMLLATDGPAVERDIVLGPDMGQCCGGAVRVRIERADPPLFDMLTREIAAVRAAWPPLLLFGAGHVGRALARALAPLPLRLVWIDPRCEEFGVVPDGVEARITADWEGAIAAAPPDAGVLVLTPSHALDALIVGAALERGDFRYVGLIGSKTKRRRFESGFRALGLPEERIATLVCPVGDRGIRDKRPEIIAALVAAEIVETLLQDRPVPGEGA